MTKMSHGQRRKKGRRVLVVSSSCDRCAIRESGAPEKASVTRYVIIILRTAGTTQFTTETVQFLPTQVHASFHSLWKWQHGQNNRLSALTFIPNPTEKSTRRMNKTFLSTLFLCLSTSWAWVSRSGRAFSRLTNTRLFAVETISLESLENHEEEGTLMAESIVRWLDSEVSSLASNKIGAHYDAIVY